jgi:pyruvate,water dikinase
MQSHVELVLPFTAIDARMLSLVGGKATNLAVLTQAGLPVPAGFCITTEAYIRVTENAGLEPVLEELATTPAADRARLEACAALARTKLLAAPVPSDIIEAISKAYQNLTPGPSLPVAVRSSATAEDLPFASFAGQQDTYLNIVGNEAVLDAVRRCWASLWTDRAVNYRASNTIDPRVVRLAVVVQQMVNAQVAGVLFTANPITGRRRQAIIDASPGLGEAIVSGAVNPDHFIVNTVTSEIVERRLGDKRLLIQALLGGGTQRIELAEQSDICCLTDEQIRALAALGMQVETYYGAPQDTEWAIDDTGSLWLTQARPITTLFPLPAEAPTSEDILRVYFSVNVAQGVFRPFTPMGIAGFRLIGSSLATFAGFPPQDVLRGPTFFVEVAHRLFFDVTAALRSTMGRQWVIGAMGVMEARSKSIFQGLISDPRLRPIYTSRWAFFHRLFSILLHARAPLSMGQAVLAPKAARERVARLQERIRQSGKVPADASGSERLAAVEKLLFQQPASLLPNIMPILLLSFGLMNLANKLLQGLATGAEQQTVLRGLPYNPTTEMDLALWHLACSIRSDKTATQLLRATPAGQLAQMYRKRTLPSVMQQGLTDFLHTYGHRSVAEIDMGLPRWSEDPSHILGVLANYLQLENLELAPDIQFRRGAQEAEAMVAELTQRAGKHGWWRGKLVAFCLRRMRDLFGLREMPKFCLILLLARARELLWPVGEELVQAGRLAAAADIFFINIAEAQQALGGTDMRAVVSERRTSYEQELKRRHVPRILLSNGSEPEVEAHVTTGPDDGALRGTPASPGHVTAQARVVLDPVGAQLEPGEILVAPSTDPGWTPLFLTAGGLVMEMGGPMSHGAVVAREYGIPAVVGVPGATEHIITGQQISVDGSHGIVRKE